MQEVKQLYNGYKRVKDVKRFIKYILSINLSTFLTLFLVSTIAITIIGAKHKSSFDIPLNATLNGVPSEYIPYYNEASEIYGIPNWVLAAISKQESNFNPSTSYGGAYGIMQVQI